MLQAVVARLPPAFVRAVGRAQFRSPLIARTLRFASGSLTGTGTIRHGVGAGLRFDATGGYPGYLLGTTEPEEQALVAKNLAAGGVFYDIGANIGFYSTIAARIVGSTGHVYAFEPHPDSSVSAARNAQLNGFGNVTVVPAAVGDGAGRMTLELADASAKHRLAASAEHGLEVDVVGLDDWIAAERARPPTLVMIDVEGAEMRVLEGMHNTLTEHRPLVCCGVHWLGEAFLDYCRDELAGLGYAVTNLAGGALPTGNRWHAVLSPVEARPIVAAPAPSPEPVWAREREFHDALARELDVDALARRKPADRLDLALLALAGDVAGKTVLDAGCGQGDLTMRLLTQDANVTALDISPGMIDVVRRRADRLPAHTGELAAVAAPLEQSHLATGAFDLILGKFILHHIDIESGANELKRILRPGGRAIFIENAGDNPVLHFARERLAGRWGIPRLGTEDEHPLTSVDIDDLRGVFEHVTAHYPVFEFLVLFDRQVLRFRFRRVSRIIRALDEAIHRFVPSARRYSYRVIVQLETASGAARPR